jgi:prepilin peptidase CpaA
MNTYSALMAAPMFALLLWAAAEDLRSRRIPNWLTFSLVLGGFAQSIAFSATCTPLASVLGFCVGFAIPFVLFALGALGGGDVKLLAGVGAWFGPQAALNVFVIAAIVGAVMVVAQALAQRRGKVLMRNTAVLAVNLAHVRDVGIDHARATGLSCRSVDRPLPYAVPVLIAMAFLLASSWTPWKG